MLSSATIKKIGAAVKAGKTIPEAVEACKAEVLSDCETHQRKTGAFGAGPINIAAWIQFVIMLLTDLGTLIAPAPPAPPVP